jgi:trans-2,3-dihydro-3-hydroxyanthranilate isomerase
MKSIDFYILDVFAKQKYGGNQLAVYVDLKDELGVPEMLQIAKEINFAESTFIKKRVGENKYAVKIFTTESEIPFAGHPAIGTSYIIAKYLLQEPADQIILCLAQGEINVTLSNMGNLDNCLFKMTQSQPEFLKTFEKNEIAEQLEIDKSLISNDKSIQEVSTGLPFIIVPIKDLDSMEKIQLGATLLKDFLIRNEIYKSNSSTNLSTSLLFYTDQTYEPENDFNVRMFCLEDDLLKEDAATGSANGCFLAYLLKNYHKEVNVKVEQGFQMNRKSYLYLEGRLSEGHYNIQVGGYSNMISTGQWII